MVKLLSFTAVALRRRGRASVSLCVLCALAAIGMLLAQVSADELERMVSGVQRTYSRVSGFSADFVQIYISGQVRQQESGRVYMKKPGKMRWEYRRPEEKLFVSDGKRTYFYVPADRQVTIRDFSTEEIRSTPLLFLLGKGDISKDFQVAWEDEEKADDPRYRLLRLKPKGEASFSALLLEVEPQSYSIRRLVIIEPTGDRSEFIIANFNPHVRIGDDKFRFKIPRNVDVFHEKGN